MAEQFRISADQLIEQTKNRKIIPLCLTADIALGGGIPLGCTVLIGGNPKAGKSTLVLQWTSNAQNLFGTKAFYYPVEGRLTSKIFQQIQGIKTDEKNFVVVMPPPIYEGKSKDKIVGYQKWTSSDWWNAIGTNIKDNPESIHIVDSLSSMSSAGETAEGVGKQERGSIQKDQAQFVRLFSDIVIANRCTVFLIAQIQANTSGYGSPIQMKVGNAIKHSADCILMAKAAEKWTKTGSKGEKLSPEGHDIVIECSESALGPPHVEFRVPLKYAYGIDTLKDLIDNAVNMDIIKVGGSWYNIPFKETKDNKVIFTEKEEEFIKLQGESKVRQWFLIKPDAQKILENKVRNMVFGETT